LCLFFWLRQLTYILLLFAPPLCAKLTTLFIHHETDLENEDDDGEEADIKEALIEELENIEQDIEEVIQEGSEEFDDDGYEVYSPGEGDSTSINTANKTSSGLNSVTLGGPDSLPNINIDPMLTMDLTQYNTPPEVSVGSSETKEASSIPSTMDSEVDRHGVNGTSPAKVTAAEVAASKEEKDDDDDYVPPSKNAAAIAKENAMEANEGDLDDDDFALPEKSAGETVNATAVSGLQDETDDPIAPSLTEPSDSEKSPSDDDDDFVPSQSNSESATKETSSETAAVSKESAESIPALGAGQASNTAKKDSNNDTSNATSTTSIVSESEGDDDDDEWVPSSNKTSTTEEDDEFVPATNKDETLSQEGISSRPTNPMVNKTIAASQTAGSGSESGKGVEAGTKPSEDTGWSTSHEASSGAETNTTSGMTESEIPVDANSTVIEPINKPEESASLSTNTSVTESGETSVDIETTTETTVMQTTSKAATTTDADETTQAATIKAPIESSTVTETPVPSPEPTYNPSTVPETVESTSEPTIAYVEPTDDELDPVMNEQNIIENEAFSNGEVSTPAAGGGRDIDDFLREEEKEVKKVGGWMGFAAIVLAVWTAYQMSENPDGICAR
jgi:hypothetical protein